MKSIEDRLERINRSLTLIAAAAHGGDEGVVEAEDIMAAIENTMVEVLADVYWLKSLPGSMLNLPAPTDDEVRDLYPVEFANREPDDSSTLLEELRQRLIDARPARGSGA